MVRKIGQGQGQGHTARWWENQGDISHLARVHTRGRHASPVFAEAGHQPSLLAGRVFDQGVVITYLRTRPELPRKVPINPPAWHLGKPSASNVLLPTTQGSPPAAAPVPRFFSHWGTHTPRLTALVTKVTKQHLTFPQNRTARFHLYFLLSTSASPCPYLHTAATSTRNSGRGNKDLNSSLPCNETPRIDRGRNICPTTLERKFQDEESGHSWTCTPETSQRLD